MIQEHALRDQAHGEPHVSSQEQPDGVYVPWNEPRDGSAYVRLREADVRSQVRDRTRASSKEKRTSCPPV